MEISVSVGNKVVVMGTCGISGDVNGSSSLEEGESNSILPVGPNERCL